jgi:hypothetical protein
MNCKPNDLAVVVRSTANKHLIGRVIRVIRLCPDDTDCPCWEFEPTLFDLRGRRIWSAEDHCLRPLRDSPGRDETLDWCPVPTKEAA